MLWGLEPLDRLNRIATGRRGLPPLWLRRHVGPVASFERAPAEIAATIALLSLVREDDLVLDAGCGAGAMAIEFQRMLSPRGRYVGFDVHAAAISWCRKRFAGDARFRFDLAEVRTPYSESFRAPASRYRFPAADGEVDFVLAKSLFTHMLEPEVRHYLGEIARVLRPDRRALVSAFLLDDPDRDAVAAGNTVVFPYGSGAVRWLAAAKPTAGVAYARRLFLDLVAESGLKAERIIDGYWRRGVIAPNAQDLVVLARAS